MIGDELMGKFTDFDSPLLTVSDLARLLSLPSTGAARKLLDRDPELNACIIRVGRRIRLRKEDVVAWLGEKNSPAAVGLGE